MESHFRHTLADLGHSQILVHVGDHVLPVFPFVGRDPGCGLVSALVGLALGKGAKIGKAYGRHESVVDGSNG